MKQLLLQDLIETCVPFRKLNTGWLAGKCALCSDYKERAGFKFEHGNIVYNCFNCGVSAVFEEGSGKLSSKFKKICDAYYIDSEEISKVLGSSLFSKEAVKEQTITLNSISSKSPGFRSIKQPSSWKPLGKVLEHEDYQIKLIKYLEHRKVNVAEHDFFFSLEDKFKDRVIIPFYKNGTLFYWQARSINSQEKKRWENAPCSRDGVIFNPDALQRRTALPLFVSEGIFDAFMFDGISLLGSHISSKLDILRTTSRRCIFVIDKDSNGKALAEEVLKYGWEITFAPHLTDDINHSVQRFGKIWTASQLLANICKNRDDAELKLRLYCK